MDEKKHESLKSFNMLLSFSSYFEANFKKACLCLFWLKLWDVLLRKKTAVLLDFVQITSPLSFGQHPKEQLFVLRRTSLRF